jgi:nucleoside-diphosphate-sugar epimerase
MIVAVTGGTGFIGRHLIARHLKQHDEVRYLTRQKEETVLDGAKSFQGHVNSPQSCLKKFLSGVDVLYHCAAELQDVSLMQAVNVVGTDNLLAAAKGEIKRWVQLSSAGVYGQPMHENVTEDSSINPVNAYEKSKAAADKLVAAAAANQGVEFVVLRPSNVYGIDMPNQSLFQMISMIEKGWFFFIGPRGAIANYIHVENVVDALILSATAALPKTGKVYIVSDYCTLEEFVKVITSALNQKPIRLRLPVNWVRLIAQWGDNLIKSPLTLSRVDALTNTTVYHSSRIESELGYKHNISIRNGIAELANFWRDQVHRK